MDGPLPGFPELTPIGGERPYRRPAWTEGEAVELADGSAWYCPRTDLGLLVTDDALRGEFARTLELARDFQGDGMVPLGILQMTRFHAQIANVAVRLLQANYDLPDDTWRALLRFEGLPGMLALTMRVAAIVAVS